MTSQKKARSKKVKPIKQPKGGTRWMVCSPYQTFENTLAHTRKMAWFMFRYCVSKDSDSYKRKGWKAVKVNVQFRVLP